MVKMAVQVAMDLVLPVLGLCLWPVDLDAAIVSENRISRYR